MKILIAPNSMKGSLSAFDFADAIENGFRKVSGDFIIRKIPVADGGDFSGEVLRHAFDAMEFEVRVRDPLCREIISRYWIRERSAIIEMANASGMKLIEPELLNPMIASSFGTGELIRHAAEMGCTEVVLAVGGSATVDGGTGMLEALGFRFYDKAGERLSSSGRSLSEIVTAEVPENICKNINISILCDVNNPLTGPEGAAEVFAPQKGADKWMVKQLETGLKNWAELIKAKTGIDVDSMPGMGAAGGIASGIVAFLGGKIVPGADFIFDKLRINEAIEWADLIITGEGKLDSQSLFNKAPGVLARRAKAAGKPVVAITGIAETDIHPLFDGVFSITDRPMSSEMAMNNAYRLVEKLSVQIAGLLICQQKISL